MNPNTKHRWNMFLIIRWMQESSKKKMNNNIKKGLQKKIWSTWHKKLLVVMAPTLKSTIITMSQIANIFFEGKTTKKEE